MSMCKLSGAVATALALCAASASSPAAPAAVLGEAPVGSRVTSAAAAFQAMDADKNGALSAQEFAAGYAVVQRRMTLAIRLREQFGRVDADHNGAINATEYANLMLVRRAGATAPPLAAFDTDKNGSLDFAEYLAAIRRLAPAPSAAK